MPEPEYIKLHDCLTCGDKTPYIVYALSDCINTIHGACEYHLFNVALETLKQARKIEPEHYSSIEVAKAYTIMERERGSADNKWDLELSNAITILLKHVPGLFPNQVEESKPPEFELPDY